MKSFLIIGMGRFGSYLCRELAERGCEIMIADENEDIKVCKVDVDDQPELTSSFGIQSIPTLIVFKNGEIVNKAVGARSKEDILAMVK